MKRVGEALLPLGLAVGTILVLGALVLLALGANPITVGGEALAATLWDGYGLSQVLFRATPLILCGLAVALPLQAGLFNVGAEGQLAAGGLACAVVGQAWMGQSTALAFVAGLVASMVAGGAAGALAGVLKHRRGVHEVISTIMLNAILAALCGWLLHAGLAEAGTSHTVELEGGVLFTRLSTWWEALAGSNVSTSLVLAVVVAVACQVVMARSRFGFEVRAVGASLTAAHHAGIPQGRVLVGVMGVGGALAGLAGAHFVLGARRFFEEGMSGGDGFLAIAVALLARNAPLQVIPASLLFAALSQAGLSLATSQVPRESVLVLQGVVVLVLGGASPYLGRRAAARAEA